MLDASRELYADDFSEFGYEEAMAGGLDPSDAYSAASIMEVGRLIERSERINDLGLRAQALASELRELRSARVTVPVPQNGVVQRFARRLRGRTSTAAGSWCQPLTPARRSLAALQRVEFSAAHAPATGRTRACTPAGTRRHTASTARRTGCGGGLRSSSASASIDRTFTLRGS